ncbi:MAG: hypothetical protein MJ061_01885 [Mailhella sp.]|nr:hypothetical protein [Mailhella sp.]
MELLDRLFAAMAAWNGGDPRRIQHFIKVHALARLIGLLEGLGSRTLFLLEAVACVHDIGIRPSEVMYGVISGGTQEEEGPAPARAMLSELGFPPDTVERVCLLVGRHHTYEGIDAADWQILVEADFLVNLFEDGASRSAVESAYAKIFRTASGRELCRTMYGI